MNKSKIKIGLVKFLSLANAVSQWIHAALSPDEDGTVRITTAELETLAKSICHVFGWKPEITIL